MRSTTMPPLSTRMLRLAASSAIPASSSLIRKAPFGLRLSAAKPVAGVGDAARGRELAAAERAVRVGARHERDARDADAVGAVLAILAGRPRRAWAFQLIGRSPGWQSARRLPSPTRYSVPFEGLEAGVITSSPSAA